eukprot:3770111-Alexandrium_andersonii.AAC.1
MCIRDRSYPPPRAAWSGQLCPLSCPGAGLAPQNLAARLQPVLAPPGPMAAAEQAFRRPLA